VSEHSAEVSQTHRCCIVFFVGKAVFVAFLHGLWYNPGGDLLPARGKEGKEEF